MHSLYNATKDIAIPNTKNDHSHFGISARKAADYRQMDPNKQMNFGLIT